MPLYAADTIEIWRSVTSIAPEDFTLADTFDDPGTAWTWADTHVEPQELYIYKSRRWELDTETYSAFSALAYGRGPWPQGENGMPVTFVGIQSLLGYGREINEAEPVEAQILLRRKSGAFDLDRQDPEQEELQNSDTPFIDAVPGVARVEGPNFDMTLTPESIYAHMAMLFGDPVTTTGGGTAPTAPVPTTATTGGTIPSSTPVGVKVAYVRPTDWGLTTASTAGSVTTGAGTQTSIVTVPSPSAQTGATGYNVYAKIGANPYTLQNAAPIAIGTPYVLTAPPITTGAPAPVVFNVHTWLGSTGFVSGTITEKRGGAYYAFPGVAADSFDLSVDKVQNTPIQAQFALKALNHLVYSSLEDLGLDAAGFDTLPAWGPAQATVKIGGTVSDAAKTFSAKVAKNLHPRDVLDGLTGANSHYSEGCEYTGAIGMYFGSAAESEVYFGVLDGMAKPYGMSKTIRTVPLELALVSQINAAGYRNKFIVDIPKAHYKKVGKPVAGKGAIMQAVDYKGFLDNATGAGIKYTLWSSQSNGTITTQGTPLTAVPVNDMTSFSA